MSAFINQEFPAAPPISESDIITDDYIPIAVDYAMLDTDEIPPPAPESLRPARVPALATFFPDPPQPIDYAVRASDIVLWFGGIIIIALGAVLLWGSS